VWIRQHPGVERARVEVDQQPRPGCVKVRYTSGTVVRVARSRITGRATPPTGNTVFDAAPVAHPEDR
jgi:hypothetical protein